MQSTEGNPQGTTPQPVNSNPQSSVPTQGIVRGAKTTFEFLKNNTNPNLQQVIDPVAIAAQVKEQMESVRSDPSNNPSAPSKPIEKIVEQLSHDGTDANKQPSASVSSTPPNDAAPKEPQSSATSDTPDSQVEDNDAEEDLGEDADVEDLVNPTAIAGKKTTLRDSYRALKAKHKEVNNELKKERDEKESWKKKSEDYETGTAIPQVLQEKEDRIQKLTQFKDLVDFRSSDEYEEKFTKPIDQKTKKLKALTEELGLPVEEVLKASKGSEAQFNQFLSEHLDVVSAMEAKTLVSELNGLEAQRTEAERSPQQRLEQMRQESARAGQVREAERKNTIQTFSKRSWINTLNKIKQEGKFTALIYSDTDKDFNERVVKPLLTHAATEFGKTINILAEAGLKELTPELAEAIALGHLYGTSSGVVAEAAFQAMQDAEQIRNHTKNLFKFNRPSIGRGSPNTSAPSGGGEKPAPNPTEAARQITQKILAERKS